MGDLDGFAVADLLRQPLTAHLATTRPAVRPVWFLREEELFWVLTGPWSDLATEITENPEVALTVDTCDVSIGECLQVGVRGRARLVPFDRHRALRKLTRYLGPDTAKWDSRFRRLLVEDVGAAWVCITPDNIVAKDLSFTPSLVRRPDG